MAELLPALQVDIAGLGNHELDGGIENYIEQRTASGLPWLCSNCDDKHTGEPLGGGERTHVLERGGLRIGFMGLIEGDWITTLAMDTSDLVYQDFCIVGNRLEKHLREDEGCHVVVALTHMRVPNDLKLAREVPGLDLILGGHDHSVEDAFMCLDGTLGDESEGAQGSPEPDASNGSASATKGVGGIQAVST